MTAFFVFLTVCLFPLFSAQAAYTIKDTTYKDVLKFGSSQYGSHLDTSGETLYIDGGEDIILEFTLHSFTKVVLNSGSFTFKNGNSAKLQITGNSEANAKFVSAPSVVLDKPLQISGTFSQVEGEVTLSGTTTIVGGSPTITGNGKVLTVKGGTSNIVGPFHELTLSGSVEAFVFDKKLGASIDDLTLENGGKIKVGAGATLKVGGGRTVTPVKETTFSNLSDTAGTLPAAADGYETVTGTWTLEGDATILKTSSTATDTVISVPAGKTLTVGGDLSQGQAMVFKAPSDSANAGHLVVNSGMSVTINQSNMSMGNITLNRGNLTLTTQSINTGSVTVSDNGLTDDNGKLTLNPNVTLNVGSNAVTIHNGGKIALNSSAQLQTSERIIKNSASSPFILTAWGTLPDKTTVGLSGTWILPIEMSATVSSLSPSPTVEGHGGDLTISGKNVYAKGAFKSLSNVNADNPLNVRAGDIICTENLSVMPKAETQFTQWGVLPGNSSVQLPNADASDEAHASAAIALNIYEYLTGAWKLEPGDNITVNSTSYNCGVNGHTHVNTSVTPTTGGGSSVVYVSSASLQSQTGIEVRTLAGSTIEGVGQELTAIGTTSVYGTFGKLTGTVSLSGDTTIKGTDNSSGTIVTGNGHALTVSCNVKVRGTFSSVTTDGEQVSVQLADDVVINGGKFAIADTGASTRTVTVGGGEGTIEGKFQRLVVKGGTITDSDSFTDDKKLTLKNKNAECLMVTSGSDSSGNATSGNVTLDNRPDIELTESDSVKNAVYVQGGTLEFWNGNITAHGVGTGVVYVGKDGKFYLGEADNQYAYDDTHTPYLTAYDESCKGVNVGVGGEAWLRAGDIVFYGTGGYGIAVSGTAHIYPNDQYGENAVSGGKARLYVHGGDMSRAAMWVYREGQFDIRGRGALLEEPSPHKDNYFALYVDETAGPKTSATEYPLSGGTFNGKVRCYNLNVTDFIPPNHYVRYDGAAPCYTYTDGTYGVLHYSENRDTPSDYGSYEKMHGAEITSFTTESSTVMEFGKFGEFYSIADAEWELRQQMSVEGGSYQIPAGIVRNDGNLVLDANVFHCVYDANENVQYPASSVWGMGKQQGDVEVKNAGHTLYLAGRRISYTGKNRNDKLLSGIYTSSGTTGGYGYDHDTDAEQIFYITKGAELTVRDCVSAMSDAEGSVVSSGSGVDTDAGHDIGGYIATGEIDYQYQDAEHCRAIYNGGTLNLVSAQILSTQEGVYTAPDSVTNIGEADAAYGDFTNGENNSNKIIDIIGQSVSLSMQDGTANLYGGAVGDIGAGDTGANAVGIEIRGGRLNLNGGIVSGRGAGGTGLHTTGGVSYIHGGCLYGQYAADSVDSSGRNSLLIEGGTVYLNIDESHGIIPTETTEKRYLETVPTEFNTSAVHHIENVSISKKTASAESVLYVGVDATPSAVKDSRSIVAHTRINGALNCGGGTTYFYQGVVKGATTVTGADAADFTTEFFVNDGHFSSLSVESGGSRTYNFLSNVNTGKGLQERVQIHGGAYASISVEKLSDNISGGIDVQKILGFWTQADDLNEDGTTDWIRCNHYAEWPVDASRNEDGYWTVADELKTANYAERAPANKKLVASAGTAVVVRDALDGFYRWITNGAKTDENTSGDNVNPHNEYVLTVNLWLDNSSGACKNQFNCVENVGPSYGSFAVGKGEHLIEMSNWGIFGRNSSGALIQVPSKSVLIITNGSDSYVESPPEEATATHACRIYNLANNTSSVAVEVQSDGTFTLHPESELGRITDGYENITLRAYGKAVTVESDGTFVMNAGILEGHEYGLRNAGAATINLPDAKNVANVIGRTKDGVVNTGSLTILGTSGKNIVVEGRLVNGVTMTDGWMKSDYATITGGTNGVVNSSQNLNDGSEDDATGVTMRLANVKVTGTSQDGVNMTQGALYMEACEVTGGTNGINNASAALGQDKTYAGEQKETVTLTKTTVTGTAAKGIVNGAGTFYIAGCTVTGGVNGIDNSSGAEDGNGNTITLKEENTVTSAVLGNTGIGVITSKGKLDVTMSVVTGRAGSTDETGATAATAHGVHATGEANVAVHAGAQVNATGGENPSATYSALWADTTGSVTIDGGSLARGKGYGVQQENGEFTITGGNLGAYTISSGKLTVEDGKSDGKATFDSVEQSGGEVTLSGAASMGDYTHSGGKVTVNAMPSFTTFAGASGGTSSTNGGPVTLNGGKYAKSITNSSSSAMLADFLGKNAIVVCDGSNTVETHDYVESDVVHPSILTANATLQTQTYQKEGNESVNLAAPFSITRPDIEKIEIGEENYPAKTEYILGETLDLTGGTLKLYYYDGTDKTIELTREGVELTCEGVTYKDGNKLPESPGEKVFTVTYTPAGVEAGEGTTPLTASLPLTVVNPKLVSIEIQDFPENTDCLQSQTTVKREGGTVKLTYNSGKSEVLGLDEKNDDNTEYLFEIKPSGDSDSANEFDNTKLGAQVVKVAYTEQYRKYDGADVEENRQETNLTITVKNDDVVSIKIVTPPKKTEYREYESEETDMTDCKLELTYRDTTTKTVEYTELAESGLVSVSGFDNALVGTYSVAVLYSNSNSTVRDTFTITVKRRRPTGVGVYQAPEAEYSDGYLESAKPPDFSGGQLRITYESGEPIILSMTDSGVEMIDAFDIDAPGQQAINFRYTESYKEGGQTFTTTVTTQEPLLVTVYPKELISLSVKPDKLTCVAGERPDLTGGTLTLGYNNGKTEDIPMDADSDDFYAQLKEKGITLTGITKDSFDSFLVGTQMLTFSANTANGEITRNCEVSIVAPYELDPTALLNGQYHILVRTSKPETQARLILACYNAEGQMTGGRSTQLDLSNNSALSGKLEIPAGAENDRLELLLVDRNWVSLCNGVSRAP